MTDTSTIMSEAKFPHILRRLREEAGRTRAEEMLREIAYVLQLTQRIKEEIVGKEQ